MKAFILEEFALFGVEAGLTLLWQLLPFLVRSLSTTYFAL